MNHDPILNQIPGLAAITISGAGSSTEIAARGRAKLPDLPVSSKTVWKIGSITKPITAIRTHQKRDFSELSCVDISLKQILTIKSSSIKTQSL
jgi:hypothetical protein